VTKSEREELTIPMTSHRKLAIRVALVTGAGSGIGRATAEKLSCNGATIAILDINSEFADKVTSEIMRNGGEAIALPADIGNEAQVSEAIQKIIIRYGRLDILVNAAASFIQEGIDATSDTWREVLGVNVIGTAQCCRYASLEMRKQGYGAIVNVASTSGLVGQANYATYNAGKAAVINLTQCLAVDLGSYGIRVNCVSPGATDTPALREAIKREGISFNDFETELFREQCLPKLCSPDEIADAISFLVSDEAKAITGLNLIVDRGLSIRR